MGEAPWLFWIAVIGMSVPVMAYLVFLFSKMAVWGALTARKRFEEENHQPTEKEKSNGDPNKA